MDYGGKAYGLMRLIQAGATVPDGFIVPPNAWQEHDFDAKVAQALKRLEDGLFVVRSSAANEDGATKSFAGMYRSALRVAAKDIPNTIRELISASPATDRMAFIVQRYVHGICSGVAFTRHPTRDYGRLLVIDADEGTAEGIVGGTATPERWLCWEDGTMLVPEETCLPRETGWRLAALAFTLETVYQTPLDIEWTFDGRKIWWLQARPITTPVPAENPVERETARLMRYGAAKKDIALDRTLYAETYPHGCSPDAFRVLQHLYRPEGAFAQAATQLGMTFDSTRAEQFLVPAFGQVYIDKTEDPFGFAARIFGGWRFALRLSALCREALYTLYHDTPLASEGTGTFAQRLEGISPAVLRIYATIALLAQATRQMHAQAPWQEEVAAWRTHWLSHSVLPSRMGSFDLEAFPAPRFTPETPTHGSYQQWLAIAREDVKALLSPWLIGLHETRTRWRNPFPDTCIPPDSITKETLADPLATPKREEEGIYGVGVSSGIVSGRIWMPASPHEVPREPGMILVVEAFTPEWFSAFGRIAGIVARYGSALSHGAIQCRERTIPAVFGVRGFDQIPMDGMITLNGKTGTIQLP